MRTKKNLIRMLAVAAGLATTGAAAAQHDHQSAAATDHAKQAAVAQCAQAQPQATRTIEAANMRLEVARQSNSPTAMRAAVDDLQSALRQLRAQLEPCAGLQSGAAADPHAGHAMPSAPQTPAAPADTPAMKPGSPAPASAAPATGKPPASDSHAGHAMPKAPATPAEKPTEKPRSAKPAPAAPKPDPHAGHTMPEASKDKEGVVTDPVNGLRVDPDGAPTTNYEGHTYHFSSEASRNEFLQNPAKFAKKPKR